jgi:hypothetical protein
MNNMNEDKKVDTDNSYVLEALQSNDYPISGYYEQLFEQILIVQKEKNKKIISINLSEVVQEHCVEHTTVINFEEDELDITEN